MSLEAPVRRRNGHTGEERDLTLAVAGLQALVRLVGDDPGRAGLIDTPRRVIAALREMCDRPGDPAQLLSRTFEDPDGPIDEMVTVGPIEFVSVCEHHLMPFTGTATVAYLPNGPVVGLSKLPRLVHHYARRLQLQERLTRQITTAIDAHLVSRGSACLIRATHGCTTCRGVRTPAPMTTTSLTGAFRDEAETRAEFLAMAQGR